MSEIRHSHRVNRGCADVYDWHTRPGAVVRMTPPALASVVKEPVDSLRVGAETIIRLLVPTVGPALTCLPGAAMHRFAGVQWRALNTETVEGVRFVDELVSSPFVPFKQWRHVHELSDTPDGGCELTDHISYIPRGGRLPLAATVVERIIESSIQRMFRYRTAQICSDLAFHQRYSTTHTIVVTGASGLVGRQLCALLGTGGHRVISLTRRSGALAEGQAHWDPTAGVIDRTTIERADVVIHLAGEPIGSRFTPQHKDAVLRSRVDSTTLLARTLADLASDGHPRALISASASGYYGPDRGDEVLSELSSPGQGFLAEVCQQWEGATRAASDAGVRVALMRTGFVQSGGGGQLALQRPVFAAGFGGHLGDGKQWMPWISVDDLVGLYAHAALTDTVEGPLNAAAPGIVRGKDYAATLARILHRPSLVPVPSMGPAMLLGREGARELALAGQRMPCDKAIASGYEFRHPTLDSALQHVLAL